MFAEARWEKRVVLAKHREFLFREDRVVDGQGLIRHFIDILFWKKSVLAAMTNLIFISWIE